MRLWLHQAMALVTDVVSEDLAKAFYVSSSFDESIL